MSRVNHMHTQHNETCVEFWSGRVGFFEQSRSAPIIGHQTTSMASDHLWKGVYLMAWLRMCKDYPTCHKGLL